MLFSKCYSKIIVQYINLERCIEMNENYIKTLDITQNEMQSRLKALIKYYPFFKITNSKYNNEEYKNINTSEVCMALISFLFYEGKLKGQKIHFLNIQDFLQMFIEKSYNKKLHGDTLYNFTNDTIDIVQNIEGRGFDISFPKFLKGKQNIKYIISSSTDSGKKIYELTPAAIDFFLETKELGEESKISISLLILKKLVEHNEYESALLSLTNVNAEVIKQISRVDEVERSLIYGGKLGYNIFLEYRNLADRHQKEEEELFIETMKQIRTLREGYASKVSKSDLGKKEQSALRCLDEMDKELNKTVELHQRLLGKIVILSKKANEILKKKKVNLIRPTFDFNTYLDKLSQIGSAKPLEYLVMPLFPLNIKRSFSLEKINEMVDFEFINPYDDNLNDKTKDTFINTDEFNTSIRERVLDNYCLLINYFYDILINKQSFTIGEIIEKASESTKDKIFKNPDFIGLIMDFLRCNDKEILTHEKRNDDGHSSLEEALHKVQEDRIEDYKIQVETIENSVVEILPGFKMTNVIVRKV